MRRKEEETLQRTETTDADDTDALAGSSVEALERRVDGNTSAKERRSRLGLESVGNRNRQRSTAAHKVRVPSLRNRPVLPDTLVRPDHPLVAVLLQPLLAEVAFEAGTALRADADAGTDFVRGARTGANDRADDFVAGDARVRSRARPAVRESVDLRDVGGSATTAACEREAGETHAAAADTAAVDLDVDVVLGPLLGGVCGVVRRSGQYYARRGTLEALL